jgi:hypothetical protein
LRAGVLNGHVPLPNFVVGKQAHGRASRNGNHDPDARTWYPTILRRGCHNINTSHHNPYVEGSWIQDLLRYNKRKR